MGKIAVVTDSTSDLTIDLLEEYDIKMIPLQVRIDNCDYKDGIDLTPTEFLTKLEEVDQLPTTSQPPVGEFVKLYQSLAQDYDYIVSIHLSKKLSGTIKAARLASNMVENVEIRVIDSETVTLSLGIMAIEIAKAVKKGKDIDEIVDLVYRLKQDIELYFTVEDLSYLEKGGRIGKAAAFLGNLFNVKPILTLNDGEVGPHKKVRGERRLYKTFKELVREKLDNKKGHKLVVLYGKYLDKGEKLKEILTDEFEWEEVTMAQLGSVVGTHVGPTPFGIAFYK